MDITIEDGVENEFGNGVIQEALMSNNTSANYGTRVNMNCNDYNSFPQNWVIKVDLTAYSDITVTLAKYILYCDSISGSSFDCDLWPVLREWNEGTKNGIGEIGSVCGVAARFSEENWTTPHARDAGTDYDDTLATGSFTSPVVGSYEIVMDNSIWQARIGTFGNGDVCHPISFTSTKAFRTQTSESANKPQFYMEFTEPTGTGTLRSRIINFGGV